MDPGEGTAKWLQDYGPWAVVVLCLVAIGVLWNKIGQRDLAIAALNKEHGDRLALIMKEHKAEMASLVDRLIASSNAQVDKFRDLAEQNARVVEALTRRMKPRDGEA